MTLFEAVGILGALVGLVGGIVVGYSRGGALGAIIGAVCGVPTGWIGFMAVLAAIFGVGIWFERFDKRRGLAPRFGRYWSRAHTDAWTTVKEQFAGNQTVTGTIVLRKYYGVFADVGCPFPAFLPTADIVSLPDGMRTAPGNSVEARVLGFDDGAREIVLTTTDHPWLIYRDIPIARLVGTPPIRDNGLAIHFPLTNATYAEFRERLTSGERVACQLLTSEGCRAIVAERRETFRTGFFTLTITVPPSSGSDEASVQ